jgi:hypothetical protein
MIPAMRALIGNTIERLTPGYARRPQGPRLEATPQITIVLG